MRAFFSWVLLIVVLITAVYLGSPWWTMWNVEQAARAGDAGAVAKVVDFPAVRASLTPQLQAKLQAALDREQVKPHSFLDKLAMFVAPLFVPKAVDTLLTPEGVAYMLKTAEAPEWKNPIAHEKATAAGASTAQPTLDLWHTGYVGDDLDQFHATVANKLQPGHMVSVKMLRRGFMTWKIIGIDLGYTRPAPAASAARSATY